MRFGGKMHPQSGDGVPRKSDTRRGRRLIGARWSFPDRQGPFRAGPRGEGWGMFRFNHLTL